MRNILGNINTHDPHADEIRKETIERLVGVTIDDINAGLSIFKDEIGGLDVTYKYIDDAEKKEIKNDFDIVKYDTKRLVLVVDIIYTPAGSASLKKVVSMTTDLKEDIEDRLNIMRGYHPFEFDINNPSTTRIVIRITKGEKIKPGEPYKLSVGKIRDFYKEIKCSEMTITRRWYDKQYKIIPKFHGWKISSSDTSDIDRLVDIRDLLLKINKHIIEDYDMRRDRQMSWNINPDGDLLFFITLFENK